MSKTKMISQSHDTKQFSNHQRKITIQNTLRNTIHYSVNDFCNDIPFAFKPSFKLKIQPIIACSELRIACQREFQRTTVK